MKGRLLILFTPLVLLLSVLGCKNARVEHAAIISQWIGHEIVLPDELAYRIQDDTIDLDFSRPDFKIVNYVDSTGCTSCRLKLDMWTGVVNEFKSLTDFDIEVVTIVNTTYIDDVSANLRRNNYLSPVAFDTCNTFDLTNSLPSRSEHHCFLLDAENKVVAIGNPVLNPKIKELYKQIILHEDDSTDYFNTIDAKPLGLVTKNSAINVKFTVSNPDSVTRHIQAMIPSCDCVTPTAKTDSISPGEELTIEVDFEADSIPGRFSKYVDVFYQEKNYPDRLTIYGYINQ